MVDFGSSLTDVEWRVHCQSTKPGDSLYLVGSDQSIGNWNPNNAIALTTDAKSFPVWATRSTIRLTCRGKPEDCITEIEYKYIIKCGDITTWESIDGNRRLKLHPNGLCKVEEVWGVRGKTTITFEAIQPYQKIAAGNSFGSASVPTPQMSPSTGRMPNPSLPSASNVPTRGVQFPASVLPNSNSQAPSRKQQSSFYRPHPVKVENGYGVDANNKQRFMAGDRGGDAIDTSAVGYPNDRRIPSGYPPQEFAVIERPAYKAEAADRGQQQVPAHANSKHRGRFRRDVLILSNSGRLLDRYVEKEVVGRGTWGEVRVVVDKATGNKRACKKIPKWYVEDIDRFRQEIDLMKSLDHPNIVRLFETFEDASDIHLLMEYCSGEKFM